MSVPVMLGVDEGRLAQVDHDKLMTAGADRDLELLASVHVELTRRLNHLCGRDPIPQFAGSARAAVLRPGRD